MFYNEVWHTVDGITWNQVTGTVLAASAYQVGFVYNNAMYVFGTDGQHYWTSTDGSTWTQVSITTPYPAGFQSGFVFNGNMYMVVWDSGKNEDDVYESTNGGTVWSKVNTAALPFPTRWNYSTFVYCGNMWLIGGTFGTMGFSAVYNDVWTSSNGSAWTQAVVPGNQFSGRSEFAALVFKNIPWVMGGVIDTNWTPTGDTWDAPCPGGGLPMRAMRGSTLGEGGNIPTPTPKVTPSVTATPSVTPTPTIGVVEAVAAPNISRNGEPVNFQLALPKPAEVHLELFTITGEQVYQTSIEEGAGLQTIVWPVQNLSKAPVASGLYVYLLQIADGSSVITKSGKVAVLH